jgi:hypothetical protein
MMRLLQPQNVNASSGTIFLLCFLWVVIGFSFLFLFLSKNKDFRRAVSTFRRLPLLVQAIFIAVISGIIVFGGSKPGGTKPFNFNTWFPAGTLPTLWAVGSGQFFLLTIMTVNIFKRSSVL